MEMSTELETFQPVGCFIRGAKPLTEPEDDPVKGSLVGVAFLPLRRDVALPRFDDELVVRFLCVVGEFDLQLSQ